MGKGTPCSSRRRATLKTLWKTHYLARSSNPAKRVRAWRKAAVPYVGLTGVCRAARYAKRTGPPTSTERGNLKPW